MCQVNILTDVGTFRGARAFVTSESFLSVATARQGCCRAATCEIRCFSWASSYSIHRLGARLPYPFQPCPSVPTMIENDTSAFPWLARPCVSASHSVQLCHGREDTANWDTVALPALSSLLLEFLTAAAANRRCRVPYCPGPATATMTCHSWPVGLQLESAIF